MLGQHLRSSAMKTLFGRKAIAELRSATPCLKVDCAAIRSAFS